MSDLEHECDVCRGRAGWEDGLGLRWCAECWDATHDNIERGTT